MYRNYCLKTTAFQDGYTRRGRCGHWRHLLRRSQIYKRPSVRLTGEACTALQPGQPKRIWVSLKIPQSALPGIYLETITAYSVSTFLKLELKIEVFELKLLKAKQDLFIWYKGTLD